MNEEMHQVIAVARMAASLILSNGGETYRAEETAARRAILADAISQVERQATGIAKAPYVCAFVRTLLEGGERVLLMAHHHAVMDI